MTDHSYPEKIRAVMWNRLHTDKGLLRHFKDELASTQAQINLLERQERTYLGIIHMLEEKLDDRETTD